ncbi:MAG: VWA domain-containing protein, partial [Halobacteriota archaeon]|nr:VWA domain-containing protein [Halobacteriota archaeon]
ASACVFVVDASGSMGAMNRMESAKGAILSLLLRSYQKRDKVGMVSFRGDRADILLPLSSSVDLAVEHLKKLPTGGRTPLSSGLIKGINLLISEKKKNSEIIPQLLLISDGHANVSLSGTGDVRGELKKIALNMRQNDINFVVIDTERVKEEYGYTRMGYCKEMVDYAEGSYYPLSELSAGNISSIVEYEWGLQYPVS